MSLETDLIARSSSQCELCGASEDLAALPVPPLGDDDNDVNRHILACGTCRDQIDAPETADPHHWRCLNDSMWSEVDAVKVMAWRMLNALSAEGWAQDALGMIYLDEETLAWAEAGLPSSDGASGHKDCNGASLEAGDTVTLIKDLNVKGANFTAKRGTAVRGISLVPDNPEHIEGRVNGQQIVILTKFVKKSS